ncbi:DUF6603 domain-containing protein [Algoriphagus namhaensis]
MAVTSLPFESLLTPAGLAQFKSQVQQVLSDPAKTAELVFQHFLDQADLPFKIPVEVRKQGVQLIIELANDLNTSNFPFKVHGLPSEITELRLVIQETLDQVDEFLVEAESELTSLRDRVSNQLAKIPYRLEIQDNSGTKQFKITQTEVISVKLQGVNIDIKSSSLTFDASQLSQLGLEADLLLPELQNEAGTGPHKIVIVLQYASGVFTASASNLPPGRLQGLRILVDSFSMTIQNGQFQSGTQIQGKVVFDFLDPGSGGPSQLNFEVELLNSGDVRYFVQNPQNQELRKGGLQLFFQQIEVVTHTSAATDVSINGWLQLAGMTDRSTGQPVRTDFSLSYADPIFDFVASNLQPAPLGFGTVTLDQVLFQVHKNGNLIKNEWEGDLTLPFFDDGQLDFGVVFQNAATKQLKIEASNDADTPLKRGDFELILAQYEMQYENDVLQNLIGNGQLKIPQFNNSQQISMGVTFSRSGQNETVKIEASNFGTPSIAGLEIHFSKILFHFLNGAFQNSDLRGRLKLPDSTDGAGLAFTIAIENQGADYSLLLDGSATDNELIFGPIKLEVESFQLLVRSKVITDISGAGSMLLPGLDDSFAFTFNVQISGDTTSYVVELIGVSANLSGFGLTFTQLRLESQGNAQFTASASGTLILPLFENGGGLDFDVLFDRTNSYEINVQNNAKFVSFGDFELKEVALALRVQNGQLQDFSGTSKLKVPTFPSDTSVSVSYTAIQSKYLITLSNPVQLDYFGGGLDLSSLQIDIRNDQLHEGKGSGVFRLPESTGGAGIKFELLIQPNGRDFALELSSDPGDNTLEFGPVSLLFESFNLTVSSGQLTLVSGAGALTLPGLSAPFDFDLTFKKVGPDTIFVIQLSNVAANLDDFNLHFDLIKIETKNNDFSSQVAGKLTLPVFDGNPLNFGITLDPSNQNYAVAVDGTGQAANFGMFVLQDVQLQIQVTNGQTQNASGTAGFHIPELTDPSSPFNVAIQYTKGSKETFAVQASNLPPADLSVFTITITSLAFLIEDGSFASGNLSGTVILPIFTTGNNLQFAFAVADNGNTYSGSISSQGENILSGQGLELKNIAISLSVVNGSLASISGAANFKLPGAESFTLLSIGYVGASQRLSFAAQSLPTLSLGDLSFAFDVFGFGIQNGNLVDAQFSGTLTFPAFDTNHNQLAFRFNLANGNDYLIEVNQGGGVTTLKAGDISVLIGTFSIRVLNKAIESFSFQAGLQFNGMENSSGSGPAELQVAFKYDKPTDKYEIKLENNQAIKIAGFEFTIEKLELAFTSKQMTYPFTFEGKLKIPGFESSGGNPAEVEVTFSITETDEWSGSLKGSNVTISLGSVKVTISGIEVEKKDGKLSIQLVGKLKLEGFDGMGGEPAEISVDIKIDSDGAFHVIGEVPSNNAIKVIDAPNLIRIYLSKIGLIRSASNDWDFLLGGMIENQIVIPGMDDLLPKEILLRELAVGSDFGLDMDIRWPSGLSISFGSGATEALIPVNGKFGNAVSLDALLISFEDSASGMELGVAFSGASVTLGPVAASVEGLGIEATLTRATLVNGMPTGTNNFGIVNIDIRFKPPTGLGVSLDTPVFTGGGYLFFDDEKGEYAGAVELSFMNLFAVSAIGIINSKMPDGKPGTSVLFIVSVEFGTGIALGFGFFLSGLGGILGIHRTIQVERLRDGVRSGTIQNILFPKDIVANINKILTDIKEVFPVKRDQFVLGPMAAITWGIPTILRVDLGVAIEFANPVRFGILGVLRVILPDENAALIKIQVAFLGMIDFEKGMLSFDASLFDSKVLTFGLEGDMVLRIGWGAKPDFVLSVGGFHPRFNPPTHLQIPSMKRLTLKILSGNPRLTLSCYFAVTSNTVQFGAGIDFYFGVAGFKVVGEFGFDVLFQFSPFRFIADARARLAVKAGSTTLLSLSLEFSLEGPTPWRAKGTAKFKILFFSVKVRFDVTWGDKRDTTLPNIEVFPLLLEALEDDQNWRSVIGTTKSPGLRMKAIKADEGLILTSNGTIELSQKIVPLEVEISKFGQFEPADFTKFEVTGVTLGGNAGARRYIQDDFAPANFLKASDNDKLSLPSFEKQNAGVSIGGTDDLKSGTVVDREVKYEQLIMDEAPSAGISIFREQTKKQFSQLETTFFTRTGAVGQSMRSARKSRIINPDKVELKQPGFAVVGTDDLAVIGGAQKLSYMDAVQFAKASDITGKQSIQVVSSDVLAL